MDPQATERRGVVWIVDDSDLERTRASQVLEQAYQIAMFSNGAAAIEATATQPLPNLLILDWNMPGMSGIEVCHFLRASEATAQLPILLLTSHQQTDDIVTGLAAGANDYVCKPYADAELAARVASIVRTRRLHQRVERAEAYLRGLLDNLPDAFVATNASGRIVFHDRRFEALCGTPGTIVGKSLGEVLPDLHLDQLVRGSSDNAARTDLTVGERSYAPSVRLLSLEDETLLTVSLRDVTEHRLAERRRLDLYAIIAHDLRTPLSALAMRLDLMLTGRRGPLSEKIQDDVQRMKLRTGELVGLINDFLELAQLEGGRMNLRTAPFDLGAMVIEAIDELRETVEVARVELRFEEPPERLVIPGDVRRLRQVLTNLLSNAIKFTPPQGQIVVRIAPGSRDVEVSVTDSGSGVPAELLPKLFQRYARGGNTQVAGTGLGLMIVREIVEAHRGTVGVSAAPGGGSRFWFRLPTG